MLAKPGSALAPYFCNRIADVKTNIKDIQEICPVDEVRHIETHLNPADLPTRGLATPDDIREDSMWQQGPAFLKLEREEWPTRSLTDFNLPEEAKRVKLAMFAICIEVSSGLTGLQLQKIYSIMDYSDDLRVVTRIAARLIAGFRGQRSLVTTEPSVEELTESKNILLGLSQYFVRKAWKLGKLTSLQPMENKDGIIVTTGRLGYGMKAVLGQTELPILFPTSRLATLIIWKAHREMHRATPAETAARSRKYAWIIRAKIPAISVCKRCMLCRTIHLTLGRQIMGDRRPEYLIRASPFTFTALDLLGPFMCRVMVNSRAEMKVWGVVYVCLGTGAARAFLWPGCDTLAFLTAHSKFTAIAGNPQLIVSDRGSQLRKAARSIEFTDAEDPGKWNWDQVEKTSADLGTRWEFIPPGTQWRNRAEAAVKVLKATINLTINSQRKLNFCELETVMFVSTNMMNERPLTVRVYDEYTFHPLTANQILLGRTNSNISGVNYAPGGSTMERLQYREEVEELWWQQFASQVLPSLVPYTRWKTTYPNRKVGDIVYVYYPGIKKGEYRIAKVSEVFPDKKGNVRTLKALMRTAHRSAHARRGDSI